MCCVEGQGSYDLKVDDIAIVEGGDFKKSEQFWFKFQNCIDDSDCDEGDLGTTSVCRGRGTTCVYFPRACNEYGHMVYINTTTYNFPESATWVIEDKEGMTKYEGGPYELSKRTFAHDTCLPDGVYKLRNTGSDLIGCRLEIGNDGLVINEEYLQSGETKTIVVGQPLKNPTPQLMPSLTPSIAYTPILTNLCNEYENKLFVEFMADNKSEEHNKLFIESSYQSKWVERIAMQNFRSSNLNTFTNCLSKSTCHRLKLTDAEANGICCDNGQGWYNVYWNGKSTSFNLNFTTYC